MHDRSQSDHDSLEGAPMNAPSRGRHSACRRQEAAAGQPATADPIVQRELDLCYGRKEALFDITWIFRATR